jgi:hypothetical protein
MKLRHSFACTAIAGAVFASTAVANYVRPLSAKEKFKASDLVVVAVPVACTTAGRCEMRARYVLKGELQGSSLAFDRMLMFCESTVKCCASGHLYLMYLKRGRSVFISVNGPYGIVDLSETQRD